MNPRALAIAAALAALSQHLLAAYPWGCWKSVAQGAQRRLAHLEARVA